MGYRVELTSSAVRDLNRVPSRYVAAIIEFMYGPLAENPDRVGGPLGHELAGSRSARRGSYRVLYTTSEADRVVLVHRIDHRASVYRPR